MRPFAYYLETGEVRRTAPDPPRAASLEREAKRRIEFLKGVELNEVSAMIVLENHYEAVRELVEAKMLLEGFKSYSHIADLAFAGERGLLKQDELAFVDKLRALRNGSHYYGREISIGEAKEANERTPPIVKTLTSSRGSSASGRRIRSAPSRSRP